MIIKVKEATSLLEKTKGLLGTSQPHPLLLKTRWGIHTFCMKYPIDVIILDSSNKIVELKQNLQPNRIFLWNPKFNLVLELPAGTIPKHKLTVNQNLSFVIK